MPFFKPDEFLTSVGKIDLKALSCAGIQGLLLDIDNTILSRETNALSEDAKHFLEESRQIGFKICLVSNNWHKSVCKLADDLDLPIIRKSMKPLPFAFFIARKKLGISRKHCIAVGDQLMTDVIGAHLSGMKAIMVLPLAAKDLSHTLFLRKIEKLLLGNDIKPTR